MHRPSDQQRSEFNVFLILLANIVNVLRSADAIQTEKWWFHYLSSLLFIIAISEMIATNIIVKMVTNAIDTVISL